MASKPVEVLDKYMYRVQGLGSVAGKFRVK